MKQIPKTTRKTASYFEVTFSKWNFNILTKSKMSNFAFINYEMASQKISKIISDSYVVLSNNI
jgi:hypothetical protein